jgi:hypothetical protein
MQRYDSEFPFKIKKSATPKEIADISYILYLYYSGIIPYYPPIVNAVSKIFLERERPQKDYFPATKNINIIVTIRPIFAKGEHVPITWKSPRLSGVTGRSIKAKAEAKTAMLNNATNTYTVLHALSEPSTNTLINISVKPFFFAISNTSFSVVVWL